MDEQPEFQNTFEQAPGPEIISASQSVNLTCTIASFSALAALFLLFADQRSKAVRRFAVQSVGLGAMHIALMMACWLLSAILGWIPLIGYLLTLLFLIALAAASVAILLLRLRMMVHAYRGEAHVLPVIGQALRRFE